MPVPRDQPVIDTLIGFRDTHQMGVASTKGDWKRHPAEYMFKDIPDEIGEGDNRLDSIGETLAQMDAHNIRVGVIHMSDDRAEEAMRRYPGPLCRYPPGQSQPGHGRGAPDRPRACRGQAQGRLLLPFRPATAGADQLQAGLSGLCQMHRARPADLHQCRRARPAHSDDAAMGRPSRRGRLRFSRAQGCDAPRCRARCRSGGQAAAQMAEPLLFDQRLRAEILARGDRQIRQFARGRQGDLRRLFPDGAGADPDLSPRWTRCRSRTLSGPSSSTTMPRR